MGRRTMGKRARAPPRENRRHFIPDNYLGNYVDKHTHTQLTHTHTPLHMQTCFRAQVHDDDGGNVGRTYTHTQRM